MPIVVAHEPPASTVAQAAAAAGQDQYAQKQQQLGLQAAQVNSANQARQQQLALQQQQMQLDAYFKQQAQMTDLYKFDVGIANQVDRDRFAADVDDRRLQSQADRDQQRFDAQQDLWDHQFTTKQKAEIDKMNAALDFIDANRGTQFTDEEATALEGQVKMRMAGVKPRAIPTPAKAPPIEQSVQENVFRNDDGSLLIRQPDGKLRYEPPQKQPATGQQARPLSLPEFSRLIREQADSITDAKGELLPQHRRAHPDGAPMTVEEVAADRVRRLQQLQQLQSQGGQTGPVLPGQVPGPQGQAASPPIAGGRTAAMPGTAQAAPPADQVVAQWEQSPLMQQVGPRHPDLTPQVDQMLGEWFVENQGNNAMQGAITDLRTIMRVYGKDERRMPPEVRDEYLDLRQAFRIDKPEGEMRAGAQQLREQIERGRPQAGRGQVAQRSPAASSPATAAPAAPAGLEGYRSQHQVDWERDEGRSAAMDRRPARPYPGPPGPAAPSAQLQAAQAGFAQMRQRFESQPDRLTDIDAIENAVKQYGNVHLIKDKAVREEVLRALQRLGLMR